MTDQEDGAPSPEHWHEQRYWTDALEMLQTMRRQGVRHLHLDLDAIESVVFNGDGPAYRALEAFADIHRHEGYEGYRGAPRVAMALMLRLAMCSEPKTPGSLF